MFTFTNCARESSPTGGPTDTIAPYAVFEKPVNNSQNINPQKIVVKFNEYIGLDNVDDNCMISPMLEEKPTISVKKKKMIIDMSKQKLQPNTTYSFNFSNAIKDLTESNITNQYIYAFSTGTGIDTMRISGKVTYAENGKIPEHAYVLLYDNLSDTAIKTQKPRYITQTSKKGEFSFLNIEAKPYRIYALEDADKDFTFNQVSEKVAFLDTIFNPTAERYIDTLWFTHNDTTFYEEYEDSISITQVKDSFNLVEKTRWSDQNVKLELFENDVWEQEVQMYKRLSKYVVACKFAAKDNKPIDITSSPSGKYEQEYVSSDSLMFWLTDMTLMQSDSAKIFVTYHVTKDGEKTNTDTIIVEVSKDLPPRLLVQTSLEKNNKVFVGDSILLTLSRPLQSYDLNKIAIYKSCDSSKTDCMELKPQTDYGFRPKFHYQDQCILKYKDASDRFALYFGKDIDIQKVTITLDGMPDAKDWCIMERDEKSNAILVWVKPGTDALRLKNMAITVTYPDSNGKLQTKNFNTKKEVPVQKLYKSPVANKKLVLFISDEQKDKLKSYEPIRIVCNNPISTIDSSLFSLINVDDTTETSVITGIHLQKNSSRIILIDHVAEEGQQYTLQIKRGAIVDMFGYSSREFIKDISVESGAVQFVQKVPYTISPADENGRTFTITGEWETNTNYSLIIPDSTFSDVFGDANDSTFFAFQTPKKEGFGTLLIKNTTGFPSQKLVFVIESQDNKESVTYIAKKVGNEIRFENIPAGLYSLRCFVDENDNKKWDSGCIEIKRQPEKIYYFKGSVTVKSEWENSILWDDFK